MIQVYLVTAECGDYYCGCGLGHLVGVYSSEGSAKSAVEWAKKCQVYYGKSAEESSALHLAWSCEADITPVALDSLPPILAHYGERR